MTLIQVVLTAGIIIIAAYMYMRLRNTFLDLVLILLFLITGVVFVIFNEITDKMAHFLGIGRGADMIFYLGLLFLFFLMLKLYARLRRVEENLTELVRKKSIEDAEELDKKN